MCLIATLRAFFFCVLVFGVGRRIRFARASRDLIPDQPLNKGACVCAVYIKLLESECLHELHVRWQPVALHRAARLALHFIRRRARAQGKTRAYYYVE